MALARVRDMADSIRSGDIDWPLPARRQLGGSPEPYRPQHPTRQAYSPSVGKGRFAGNGAAMRRRHLQLTICGVDGCPALV